MGNWIDGKVFLFFNTGNLMSECGESDSFVITAVGPSDALMCATRVLLANETEVKALEGGGADPHWSGSRSESESETVRLFFNSRTGN